MEKLARRNNVENVKNREQRKPTWFRKSVVLLSSLAPLGVACAPAVKKPAQPSVKTPSVVVIKIYNTGENERNRLVKICKVKIKKGTTCFEVVGPNPKDLKQGSQKKKEIPPSFPQKVW